MMVAADEGDLDPSDLTPEEGQAIYDQQESCVIAERDYTTGRIELDPEHMGATGAHFFGARHPQLSPL
jgi:hypothetical protein